jgi:hypothetical protein
MTPSERLAAVHASAAADLVKRDVAAQENQQRIDRVARRTDNKACVRLVMACMLAKLDRPDTDPRRPYTEIPEPGPFSGRSYDEGYLSAFITEHGLPCNSTTAFLTPALRNIDYTLTPDRAMIGRPRQLYADALNLLNEVAEGRETAEAVLIDTVRVLLLVRDENRNRLAELLSKLPSPETELPLSSEAIVTLIRQHSDCPRSSRLPVLVVTAAYESVSALLGERHRPLAAHNAADEQTGAAGDIEITLVSDDELRTVYEIKQKKVTHADIERARQKVARLSSRPDNYIFVTTDAIDPEVGEYAAALYAATGGTEFAILDCLGFLRHFLHLFHRHRTAFLNAYQALVVAEPESAVSFELKQAFLALRQAASPAADGA